MSVEIPLWVAMTAPGGILAVGAGIGVWVSRAALLDEARLYLSRRRHEARILAEHAPVNRSADEIAYGALAATLIVRLLKLALSVALAYVVMRGLRPSLPGRHVDGDRVLDPFSGMSLAPWALRPVVRRELVTA